MPVAAVAAAAAAAAAPAAGRPNILLLFPDQWRYDWAGFAYPQTCGPRDTVPLHLPTVAGVAGQGVRFTQAYVPAPLCAPSRSCLASARDYDDMVRDAKVPTNQADYDTQASTFYSQLRAAGYHTMVTGKDDLTKASGLGFKTRYPGCDDCQDGDGLYHLEELGFSDGLRSAGKNGVFANMVRKSGQKYPEPFEMYGYALANRSVSLDNGTSVSAWDVHVACMTGQNATGLCDRQSDHQELYEDDWVAANAVQLLRRWKAAEREEARARRGAQDPFFMQVNFPGPHPPFAVTAQMADGVAGVVWPNATDDPQGLSDGACALRHLPSTSGKGSTTPNGGRRCDYAAEVLNLDGLFKVVLDELDALNETANTLVCMSSDHGEMLGDHGDYSKQLPWQGSASVPLICKGPGVARGAVVDQPVGTVDLAATFLDYGGASPAAGMTAVSLRGLLGGGARGDRGAAAYREVVKSGLDAFNSKFPWRMVVTRNGTEQKSYKLICCKGACPQPPSTAPAAVKGWTTILIDVDDDPYDMRDLTHDPAALPLLQKMLAQLPEDYAAGCAAAAVAPPPGPSPPGPAPPAGGCSAALGNDCGAAKGDTQKCVQCAQANLAELRATGCKKADIGAFCTGGL